MDLLDRLTSACVTRIVHARIERHVAETCKGNFTVSHLGWPCYFNGDFNRLGSVTVFSL